MRGGPRFLEIVERFKPIFDFFFPNRLRGLPPRVGRRVTRLAAFLEKSLSPARFLAPAALLRNQRRDVDLGALKGLLRRQKTRGAGKFLKAFQSGEGLRLRWLRMPFAPAARALGGA
jgi:hypothetical protein